MARSLRFAKEEEAAALTGRVTALMGGIIALIVILSVIAATLPDMFSNVGSVNENLTTGTTGDATADTIADVFPVLVGVTFVLGIVGVVLAVFKFRGGN